MKYAGKRFIHFSESQKVSGVPDSLFAEWREVSPNENDKLLLKTGWEIFTEQEYQVLRPENDRKLAEWLDVYGPKSNEQLALIAIKNAREFGESVIDEFAAFNVLRGLDTENVLLIANSLKDIMSLLQSGSLYAALKAMSLIQPSELLPEEKVLEFGNKIRNFLRRDSVNTISELEISQ